MKLDYESLISPYPTALNIGSLRKPTLGEIFDTSENMSYEKYCSYLTFLTVTPRIYYTELNKEQCSYWNELPLADRAKETLYDIILKDEKLKNSYLDVFNFFFVEKVVFQENMFILLKNTAKSDFKINDISGVISPKDFTSVLDVICQICCIERDVSEDEEKDMVFENELARKIFEKINNSSLNKKKKVNKDASISNIMSVVASKHPSLNYTNIWNLTVFQLLDTYDRLKINAVQDIEATRTAVWGDKKKKFDPFLWCKHRDY